MINLNFPDKWVRKAIFDLCNNQTVDGQQIPVFDQVVTADPEPDRYILIRIQTNSSAEQSFCGYQWSHTVTLEAFTRTPANGNPGSRVALDNIVQMIITQLQALSLDAGSGLTIKRAQLSTPGDFYDLDDGYAVAAKTLLLQLNIN